MIIAVLFYYVVHEGTHIIIALIYGVFEKIKILGLGMQVVINKELLTDIQIGIFCISSTIATIIVSYILILLMHKIIKTKSKLFKAICYHVTIAFLLIDPLYLAIIYRLFGGGDMNGILLFKIPEIIIQTIFGIIFIINMLLIFKKVYPTYKKDFNNSNNTLNKK